MKKKYLGQIFGKEKYKVIVLDMDGTLYYQRKLQILMCLEMGAYAIKHPFSLWKFRTIFVFRKIREKEIFAKKNFFEEKNVCKSFLEIQYQMTGNITKKTSREVAQVVEEWIFKRPLKYMKYVCDTDLCQWIEEWRKRGIKIVIYSDYPVKEKCDMLELEVDKMFSSEERQIGCMKPSIRGLEVISRELMVMPEEMLVIGDRVSKDGRMAEAFGCESIILPKWKFIRKRYYYFS